MSQGGLGVARRPVVVTGLGVVSPIGNGVSAFWSAVLAGRTALGEVSRFDTSGYQTHKAAEVPDLPPAILGCNPDGMARSTQFALAAARMAADDAKAFDAIPRRRTGVCFGMVIGNRPLVEERIHATGELLGDPNAAGWMDPSEVSRVPAAALGFAGPNLALPNACAAGNVAIGQAAELVASGRCDAMLAGGSDEVSRAMFMMFNSFKGLARDVVAPFDRDRDGLMLGEGAAALFLESEESAARRGAHVYGRVLGHASFCDAHHMTAPHPAGRGAIRSMRAALDSAGKAPDEIDYVSAHGTATPANDAVEALAIRAVLDDTADEVPVSSIKGAVGHMQGAAAVVEAIVCLLAMRDGIVPANIGLKHLDPECRINAVVDAPRERRVRLALNNAFGFGGSVSCLALGAP